MRLTRIQLIRICNYMKIAIIFIAMSFAIFQFYTLEKENISQLHNQTKTINNLFITQYQYRINPYLEKNNIKELNKITNDLSLSPLILDATIYNKHGIVLSYNKKEAAQKYQIKNETPLNLNRINKQQLITEIHRDNKINGFLRVTLNIDKIISPTKNSITGNTNLMRFLLLFLFGLILFTFKKRIYYILNKHKLFL